MELVEDNTADTFEGGIIGKTARENALGDNLYARRRRHLAFETHLIANALAHPLAEEGGHAGSHLPGSNTARLEHDDAAGTVGAQQRQRQQRRLTGTGRCHDDGCMAVAQGTGKAVGNSRGWKVGRGEHTRHHVGEF